MDHQWPIALPRQLECRAAQLRGRASRAQAVMGRVVGLRSREAAPSRLPDLAIPPLAAALPRFVRPTPRSQRPQATAVRRAVRQVRTG